MLNSNTFFKIISVLIAVVLWAYVIEVTEPVKRMPIADVPVQLLNEESLTARGLALSGEANYTVDVEIQAKKGGPFKDLCRRYRRQRRPLRLQHRKELHSRNAGRARRRYDHEREPDQDQRCH